MRFYRFVATAYVAVQVFVTPVLAQQDPVVSAIVKEATENSQLKRMSHELMDGVGPRLVRTRCVVPTRKPRFLQPLVGHAGPLRGKPSEGADMITDLTDYQAWLTVP